MNEREQLAWLARRAGFGPVPGQLDRWRELGVDAVVDQLVDPAGNGVAPAADPFAGLDREYQQGSSFIRDAVVAWVGDAIASERALETWMQFFWHDFFAVSMAVVRVPGLMHDHMNLLRRHALGNFGDLLRDVTTDGAMLLFLDGVHSTAEAPNENYGRELLELYTVGVGEFSEADVLAAARALTGWVIRPRVDDEAFFFARRHDDTPQTLLGVEGVHDVESVMTAVLEHPATAPRIAGLLARKILGDDVDAGVIERHAARFAEDLEIAPLVRGLLEDGLEGAGGEVLVEFFGWFAGAIRATGAQPRDPAVANGLRTAGQVPLLPPNVGGFPSAASYLGTSATVARFSVASAIATSARSQTPAMVAATTGDLPALADALGRPAGFSAATTAALESLSEPADRLAVALASPDLIVA